MGELAYFVTIRCELMHNGLFVILSQDGPVCFCSKSAKVSETLFMNIDLRRSSTETAVPAKFTKEKK